MASPRPLSPKRVVEASFKAGATHTDQLPPPTGVEIAFAGRSNVGKSSLLNAVLGRRNLVRTSSTPGCTRQISFYEAKTADGAVLTLVDLPGYGYAKRSKAERAAWATLIEGYLLGRPTLRAVVLLIDIRRGLEPDDRDLLELLRSPARTSRPELETLVVATKTDKLPASARQRALRKIATESALDPAPFSIRDPEAAADVWRRVRHTVGM